MSRDRLACWLCNGILRVLATPKYRAQIRGSILYGLGAAARDESIGADPPPIVFDIPSQVLRFADGDGDHTPLWRGERG